MGNWNKNRHDALKSMIRTRIRRGDIIDAEGDRKRNGSAPRVEGPKEQVLRIYVQVNIEAAIEKAEKLGYNEEICRTWIKEFEFKTKIQSAYKKNGEVAARALFDTINREQFNGKYRIETFRNWIKNITREVDEAR